jgi:acetyltransferase EpsM
LQDNPENFLILFLILSITDKKHIMAWIYGASGHGKVILDVLEKNKIPVQGFIDDNITSDQFMGYEVLSPEQVIHSSEQVILAIGDNATRRKIAEKYGFSYLKITDPSSSVSIHTEISEGTVIMAQAAVQPGCEIGKHAIINTAAIVDHDCKIGDFAHISPGVTLCGNVTIGENTWVGAGSIIIQGITIGKNVIVGAGSLIRKNVPDNVLVAGNPQRILRNLIK